MLNLSGNVDIRINLPNGIWVFPADSAAGKTYLYKLFQVHYFNGKPVVGYSYHDKLLGVKLDQLVDSNKHKYLLLDRYDMYNGDYADFLIEFSKHGVVLIDCKSGVDINIATEFCRIQFSEGLIEVSEI